MNENFNSTLLAILLTLNNLEVPLSPSEQAALTKAGQRLAMRPKNWESIIKQLMDELVSNSSFTQLYQVKKSQLDAVKDKITFELLPTESELKQAFLDSNEVVKRAYFEGKPDKQSKEILDLTVKVLTTEKPEETAQKLPSLKRTSQSLNQPSKND
ncbi:MAG: hypothetical protein SWX82_04980 [Cyanobacteriota bacterium]|nr:hypothetical protein [Cyanobacteriota bacterium]